MSHQRKKRKPGILDKSIDAITKRIKINHDYDVPYIAGYSEDGRKILGK